MGKPKNLVGVRMKKVYEGKVEMVRNNLKFIGPRIKRLRKSKGLTQRELGDAANMTCPAISRIESSYGIPNIESIQRIATVLETTMSHILEESDETFSLQTISSFIFKKLPSKERKMISDIANLVIETTGQGYLTELKKSPTYFRAESVPINPNDPKPEITVNSQPDIDDVVADAKSVGDWPDLLSEDIDDSDEPDEKYAFESDPQEMPDPLSQKGF